jgi:ankyrin repeat protein
MVSKMLMRRVLVLIAVCLCTAAGVRAAGNELIDAVKLGDMPAVRTLTQKKADVNATLSDGSTALHWAVYKGNLEAIDLLLRAGAKADVPTRIGMTPLAMAAEYGNAPAIDRLLKAGADAKTLGRGGETTVMLAARNGNVDAIRLLVEAGADVNAKETIRGTTALMWAIQQRNVEAVKALLAAGANPGAASGPAGLPRNYLAPRVNTRAVEAAQQRRARAVAAGRTYEEQLEWEYENNMDLGAARNAFTPNRARPAGNAGVTAPAAPAAGAAPTGTNNTAPNAGAAAGAVSTGAAPNTTAAGNAPTSIDPDDSEVVVAGLVGAGGGALTPLVFAAREGDIESARALLDAGAAIDQKTEYGWTPLLTAVNNRNYRLAQMLVERGADVNAANKGGWTPLYLATDNRNIEGGDYPVPKPDMEHLELIRVLLEKGANPNAKVKDNTLTRTIFTMQWFFEDGATAFIRASQSSDTDLMALLLKHGADPKAATANGDTALTAAAGIGWVDGVTYERSPAENLKAVAMLLDLGVDPNQANNEGRTPLMGAALKGRSDVVKLLVERGAKLDARDRGSRDTHIPGATIAGATFQAIDYAEGLVRVGVQSAVERPETAAVIRALMRERGLPVPAEGRTLNSICVTALCSGISQ